MGPKLEAMSEPLALVFYERLLPGTQLINRLQDLGYRVRAVDHPDRLPEAAREQSPLVVLADLEAVRGNVLAAIRQIRSTAATAHLPVVAFTGRDVSTEREAALAAGATMVVADAALLGHLPQMLEEALRVE